MPVTQDLFEEVENQKQVKQLKKTLANGIEVQDLYYRPQFK
jgi:hypothetical protein